MEQDAEENDKTAVIQGVASETEPTELAEHAGEKYYNYHIRSWR